MAQTAAQGVSGKRLAGKVAVVTGAGTGIGQASAVALAREGARVALSGRRRAPLEETAEQIRQAGGEALVVAGDVSKPDDVESLFSQVETKWGTVDVLFNNAGTNSKQRNIHDISLEDWNQVIDVNLSGTFYCTRRALPGMRERRSGTIINLVSIAGKRAGALGGVAYSASKAGQASLTQSILAEESQFNIRACSIFPGEVDTPIMEHRPVVPPKEARATMLQPEDVAEAVVLVASLPDRALIEEIVIRPTVARDQRGEVSLARPEQP